MRAPPAAGCAPAVVTLSAMAGMQRSRYEPVRGSGYLPPARDGAALMVIDMQNTFCHPNGAFARAGIDVSPLADVVSPCAALVDAAHEGGVPVIYVKHVLRQDCLDGGLIFNQVRVSARGVGALARGSKDAELVDGLRPLPQDFVVEKRRFSAFYGTDVEVILSSLEVRSLVICGVTTNICVESTARDAAQRNYRTYVVADAVAEVDAEKHVHALSTLAQFFCWVVRSEDVGAGWGVAVAAHAPG